MLTDVNMTTFIFFNSNLTFGIITHPKYEEKQDICVNPMNNAKSLRDFPKLSRVWIEFNQHPERNYINVSTHYV